MARRVRAWHKPPSPSTPLGSLQQSPPAPTTTTTPPPPQPHPTHHLPTHHPPQPRLDEFSGDMLGHLLRAFGDMNYYDDELLEGVVGHVGGNPGKFSAENIADVVRPRWPRRSAPRVARARPVGAEARGAAASCGAPGAVAPLHPC